MATVKIGKYEQVNKRADKGLDRIKEKTGDAKYKILCDAIVHYEECLFNENAVKPVVPEMTRKKSMANEIEEAMTDPEPVVQKKLFELLQQGKTAKQTMKRFGGAHSVNAKADMCTLILSADSDVEEIKWIGDWWWDIVRYTRCAIIRGISVKPAVMKLYNKAEGKLSFEQKIHLKNWLGEKRRNDEAMFQRGKTASRERALQ